MTGGDSRSDANDWYHNYRGSHSSAVDERTFRAPNPSNRRDERQSTSRYAPDTGTNFPPHTPARRSEPRHEYDRPPINEYSKSTPAVKVKTELEDQPSPATGSTDYHAMSFRRLRVELTKRGIKGHSNSKKSVMIQELIDWEQANGQQERKGTLDDYVERRKSTPEEGFSSSFAQGNQVPPPSQRSFENTPDAAIRLINILFHSKFASSFDESAQRVRRHSLESGEERYSVLEFWHNVAVAFSKQDVRSYGGILKRGGKYGSEHHEIILEHDPNPSRAMSYSAGRLVDIWNETYEEFRKACSRRQDALHMMSKRDGIRSRSQHPEESFWIFCNNRVDVLYLYEWQMSSSLLPVDSTFPKSTAEVSYAGGHYEREPCIVYRRSNGASQGLSPDENLQHSSSSATISTQPTREGVPPRPKPSKFRGSDRISDMDGRSAHETATSSLANEKRKEFASPECSNVGSRKKPKPPPARPQTTSRSRQDIGQANPKQPPTPAGKIQRRESHSISMDSGGIVGVTHDRQNIEEDETCKPSTFQETPTRRLSSDSHPRENDFSTSHNYNESSRGANSGPRNDRSSTIDTEAQRHDTNQPSVQQSYPTALAEGGIDREATPGAPPQQVESPSHSCASSDALSMSPPQSPTAVPTNRPFFEAGDNVHQQNHGAGTKSAGSHAALRVDNGALSGPNENSFSSPSVATTTPSVSQSSQQSSHTRDPQPIPSAVIQRAQEKMMETLFNTLGTWFTSMIGDCKLTAEDKEEDSTKASKTSEDGIESAGSLQFKSQLGKRVKDAQNTFHVNISIKKQKLLWNMITDASFNVRDLHREIEAAVKQTELPTEPARKEESIEDTLCSTEQQNAQPEAEPQTDMGENSESPSTRKEENVGGGRNRRLEHLEQELTYATERLSKLRELDNQLLTKTFG